VHNENLHCTWHEYRQGGLTTCREPATICILSGCLNGHLEEFVTCYAHFDIWTQWVDDEENPVSRCIYGDCPEHIGGWERIEVNSLSSGYALHMKTRQSP
jgi:hypothetical protein